MTLESAPGDGATQDVGPAAGGASSVEASAVEAQRTRDPHDVASMRVAAALDLEVTRARVAEDDRNQRKEYAGQLLDLLKKLLVVENVVFVLYLGVNFGHVPGSVMQAWLYGNVVQVVGLVAIVARNLFPPHSK